MRIFQKPERRHSTFEEVAATASATAAALSKAQRRALELRIVAEHGLKAARTLEERLAAEADGVRAVDQQTTAQRLLASVEELAAKECAARQHADARVRELERLADERANAEIRRHDDETAQNEADANVIACEALLEEAREDQRRAREAFTESNRRLDWLIAGEESLRSEITAAELKLQQLRTAREKAETELRAVRRRMKAADDASACVDGGSKP